MEIHSTNIYTKVMIFNSNVLRVLSCMIIERKIEIPLTHTQDLFAKHHLKWRTLEKNKDNKNITNHPNETLAIASHVLRMPPTHCPGSALNGHPQGKRNRERPKESWRWTVIKESSDLTMEAATRVAPDRARWKSFVGGTSIWWRRDDWVNDNG